MFMEKIDPALVNTRSYSYSSYPFEDGGRIGFSMGIENGRTVKVPAVWFEAAKAVYPDVVVDPLELTEEQLSGFFGQSFFGVFADSDGLNISR